MNDSTTTLYNVEEFEDKLIRDTLNDVYMALEERGYNPINQLIGYIMSGDPGYISSHKDARKRITTLERNKIVEVLLKDYMNNNK
ncbi:MAG: IreB family regulatory phosphoprotein [Firmicutes bacterium]|nr:IreB family regulatory phosphoprotein [Bacillota bacterium]